ncbi:N-acetylmuramoyl-L-alanine amidase family protein [Floccifex sp.]|uniref:N-acetylmuramoyl-L-alanine amidase family protein n=1 Tax=Floccifex sp. TaxID=2815810 RepID=UPI003EFD3B77
MPKRKLKIHRLLILILPVIIIISLIGYYLIPKYEKEEKIETIATIMIDAGHGGYDGGTIGGDGTCEKDITLALALKMGKEIEEMDPRIKVVYTRENDVVEWADNEEDDLIERVKMAKKEKADYFISIHINSNEDESVSGYYSYVRDDDEVSWQIANQISYYLEQNGWQSDLGTRSTQGNPLYVVDYNEMPSILFEAGFITNAMELNQLQQEENQNVIAKSLAQAYVEYIQSQES